MLILNDDDITYKDIFCGSNKEAFNHAGNKLFRFLIAINHSRFQDLSGRLKRFFIFSVLDQFLSAGCRFIKRVKSERLPASETSRVQCWEIVSEKEARTKITHAFRDKRHDPDISPLLARIHDTIVTLNRLQSWSSDSLYNAISAKILTVKLTGMETDAYTKNVLMKVVESVLHMESTKKTSMSLPLGSDACQNMGSKHTTSSLETDAIASKGTDQPTKIDIDPLDASRWLSSVIPFPTIPYPSQTKNFDFVDKEETSQNSIDLVLSNDLMSQSQIDSPDSIDIYCE